MGEDQAVSERESAKCKEIHQRPRLKMVVVGPQPPGCASLGISIKDIELMNELGVDAYRFSISWSRILPTGKRSGGISKEGIKYYNDLIDQLILNGKTPFVTLYHVDRPHALEEEYGGFLDSRMVDDFKDFCDVCFENFGGKVKHWTTLNEPYTYCYQCYTVGNMAPGRCSYWQKLDCLDGDSATEPYVVGHNLLLAHSAAVELYNTKYKQTQKGQIGITLDSIWCVPYSNKDYDKKAALREIDFKLGWFLEPLTSGNYPKIMQQLVGDRLPKFSEEQSKKLKGSYDFIGINYYTSQFAKHMHATIDAPPSNVTDSRTASGMYVYPRGLRELLRHIKQNYNDPIIYVTENGMADYEDLSLPIDEAAMDIRRIDYYYRHLHHLLSAIK
ncbi:hypothetical protein L6164_012446 [Bauhinia variegata]|uniref:Uncharacterized protein n=1 Tax=Bauhinia variegata TaxID=167791 RepID=A0ACB9PAE1_BAUVA|nr:hypothetical protein L6164_012446 [Bauhinia variegata]